MHSVIIYKEEARGRFSCFPFWPIKILEAKEPSPCYLNKPAFLNSFSTAPANVLEYSVEI